MAAGQVTFLGHDTFKLSLPDERVIYIDPWLDGNPSCPDSEKQPTRCDYIALTHAHDDHLGSVAALVDRFSPQVICIFDLGAILAEFHPKGQYQGMNIGGTLELDGIRFTLTRAFHSSSVSTPRGAMYGGMPGGFVIGTPGLASIYHAGDTDVFSDMQLIDQLFGPKVILLPIGDHFTMGPKGAALAVSFFNANTIVPMHYGTFPVLTGTVETFKRDWAKGWLSGFCRCNPATRCIGRLKVCRPELPIRPWRTTSSV